MRTLRVRIHICPLAPVVCLPLCRGTLEVSCGSLRELQFTHLVRTRWMTQNVRQFIHGKPHEDSISFNSSFEQSSFCHASKANQCAALQYIYAPYRATRHAFAAVSSSSVGDVGE